MIEDIENRVVETAAEQQDSYTNTGYIAIYRNPKNGKYDRCNGIYPTKEIAEFITADTDNLYKIIKIVF